MASLDTSDTSDTGGSQVILSNTGTCGVAKVTSPGGGEDGIWFTSRLTPSSYPFELAQVSVRLNHDPNGTASSAKCNASQAYEVRVFKGSTTSPPTDSPTPLKTQSFAADGSLGTSSSVRELNVYLDPDPQLTTGEYIFVSVNSHYVSDDDKTCIAGWSCPSINDATENYYSVGTDWASLTWSGWATGTFWMTATGYE